MSTATFSTDDLIAEAINVKSNRYVWMHADRNGLDVNEVVSALRDVAIRSTSSGRETIRQGLEVLSHVTTFGLSVDTDFRTDGVSIIGAAMVSDPSFGCRAQSAIVALLLEREFGQR